METIIPVSYMGPSNYYAGGVPSVSVSRDAVTSGQMSKVVSESIRACLNNQICTQIQVYHGNSIA